MSAGEKPLFVAFGKAESDELAELQRMALRAVVATGIRAEGGCKPAADLIERDANARALP